MSRAPHQPKSQLVSDVSTIFAPERTEIWTAIGKLREDLTTTNRLAMATQRQLYRKIGPQEPEDGTAIVDAPQIVPKTHGVSWRTGDPVN